MANYREQMSRWKNMQSTINMDLEKRILKTCKVEDEKDTQVEEDKPVPRSSSPDTTNAMLKTTLGQTVEDDGKYEEAQNMSLITETHRRRAAQLMQPGHIPGYLNLLSRFLDLGFEDAVIERVLRDKGVLVNGCIDERKVDEEEILAGLMSI